MGKLRYVNPNFEPKFAFFLDLQSKKSGASVNCPILGLGPKEITGVAPVSYPGWAKIESCMTREMDKLSGRDRKLD